MTVELSEKRLFDEKLILKCELTLDHQQSKDIIRMQRVCILGMRETQLCTCSHKFSGSVYQTLRFINVIDYNTTRVCENLLSAHRYILACPLSPLPGTIYILILNLLTLPATAQL